MRIEPDKQFSVKPDRITEVELGDGNSYLILRLGVGPRSTRQRQISRELTDACDANDEDAQYRLLAEFASVSLSFFYSDDRVKSLIDSEQLLSEDYGQIFRAVFPIAASAGQKKMTVESSSSTEASSIPSSGGQ